MKRKHSGMSRKGSDLGSVNTALKKKIKLGEDEEEETEEVASVKESRNLHKILQKRTKIKPEWNRLKTVNTKIKKSRIETNERQKPKQRQRTQLRRRYYGNNASKYREEGFSSQVRQLRQELLPDGRPGALEPSGSGGGLLRKELKGFTVLPLYSIAIAVDIWLFFIM